MTSGTGSGKSRTFMATIFNHVLLNEEACKDKTIAIIVYPMNALINSQAEELERYKSEFEESTGRPCPSHLVNTQDKRTTTHAQNAANSSKHHIDQLYDVGVAYDSCRKRRGLTQMFLENLHFLVFDELHTYRGMQGSDVSFLIRRIKSLAKGQVLCFGTSATMVADDSMSYSQQREKLQRLRRAFRKFIH